VKNEEGEGHQEVFPPSSTQNIKNRFSASQIGFLKGLPLRECQTSNSPSSQGPERLSDAAGNVSCGIQGFRRRISVFRASSHRIEPRFGV
jgi:hypothetical protein